MPETMTIGIDAVKARVRRVGWRTLVLEGLLLLAFLLTSTLLRR